MNIVDFFYWFFTDRVRTPTEKYLRAAERGNAKAQLQLGLCYHHGKDVPQDSQKAVRWFRLAARQGNADAMFYLGRAHYSGEGVKKDLEMAYGWFEQAAQKNHAKAAEWCTILQNELSPEQITEGKRLAKEACRVI